MTTVGGYRYVEYVGTGTVATAVLFSSAFPAMFGTFVKYAFQRTYDAILAAPVDTEELVTAEALWIATRAGVYGCVPLLVAMPFGLEPRWTMIFVPADRLDLRLRLGGVRDHGGRLLEVDRELQLHRERGLHAAVPRRRHVLPAHQPPPLGAGARVPQPAVPLRRARPPRRVRLRRPARRRQPRDPARLRLRDVARSRSTRWSASSSTSGEREPDVRARAGNVSRRRFGTSSGRRAP